MAKFNQLMIYFLFLGLDATSGAVRNPVIQDYRAFEREGDLNIGYMTDIHRPPSCTRPPQLREALESEQVALAIDRINQRTDLLPNITLGLVAVDTCRWPLTTLARVVHFLPDADETLQPTLKDYPNGVNMTFDDDFGEPRHYSVVGIIDGKSTIHAVYIAALLSAYQIPMLSQTATSDELSDKTRFPYFMRLVPPDRFSTEALVSVAERMNWTYVSLLYSEGSYGEYSARQLEKLIKASPTGMCIAYSRRMSSDTTPEEYLSIAKELKKYSKARVVFMASDRFQQMRLFRALKDLGLSQTFLFLVGDTFVGRREADGAIYLGYEPSTIPGYSEFIQEITPWAEPGNPWLREAWQLQFRCWWNITDEQSNSSCYHYSMSDVTGRSVSRLNRTGNSRLYDAVFVYAHALHSLISDQCPEHFESVNKSSLRQCVTGPKLIDYMKGVDMEGVTGRIKFDEKGDVRGEYIMKHHRRMADGRYRRVNVGWWTKLTETLFLNMSLIDWSSLKNNEVFPTKVSEDQYIPESVCSKPCESHQYSIVQELPCCWECYDCRDNERLTGNHTGCEECPLYHWPVEEARHNCIPIEPYYLMFSDPITIVLATLAISGVCVTLATAGALYRFRAHKLVRATSRELSMFILIGNLIASCNVFCFLLKPTDVTCRIRLLGFHFAINLIYSPLMVKTIRIYRIFSSGKRSVKRPRFVSAFAQLIIVVCVVLLQILVMMAANVLSPVSAHLLQRVPTVKFVELKCKQELYAFLMPLSFNMLLILICAVVGYMTRKLPENFNESWYIFVSVSTTLFAWLVFLPAYFSTYYAYQQMALLAFCLVLNACLTTGCLFWPKLYAVVFVNEQMLQFGFSMSNTSRIQATSMSTHDNRHSKDTFSTVNSLKTSSDA